ncbi:hypothetical protein predicted by Glimmer/Critica [Acetobacter ghanensis]|uniref:Uncharacterized protein n=1 Tax=Acetobacter ghanensis TaxID=431306 RepID=A0A0U5F6D1_9PROT|nr:hypothetical protein predicted by Glimmer/Critica [Acetobacter ghanensis]
MDKPENIFANRMLFTIHAQYCCVNALYHASVSPFPTKKPDALEPRKQNVHTTL